MPFSQWRPGTIAPSPVYFDASFLVISFVSNDVRYQRVTTLMADLLVQGAEIQLSQLTISESLWALAGISYKEINHLPGKAPWGPQHFYRNVEKIYQAHRPRMNAIHDMIRDWSSAGVRIRVLPNDVDALQQVSQATSSYMYRFKMASADAAHLATAELEAKSLVTADRGFQTAGASKLDILYFPQ